MSKEIYACSICHCDWDDHEVEMQLDGFVELWCHSIVCVDKEGTNICGTTQADLDSLQEGCVEWNRVTIDDDEVGEIVNQLENPDQLRFESIDDSP